MTVIINGKKRYKKITEKEAEIWDAQAMRLQEALFLAGVTSADVRRKCELKGCSISKSNFSNYCHGQREIAKNHIDCITEVFTELFNAKNISINPILFKDYLLGNNPCVTSYEEYEAYMNDTPDECFNLYSKFFAYAGMILGYDSGITIWTRKSNYDESKNKIIEGSNTTIHYDDPEYSLYYDGIIKNFTVSEMKAFYENIISNIQKEFNEYKEGDAQ